jgi:hypothetical protein
MPPSIGQMWQDLDNKAVAETPGKCNFMSGYFSLGQCLLGEFNFPRLARMAGVKPFLSGPHADTGLDLGHRRNFGHYNPMFVRWMTRNFIPGAQDNDFRAATQAAYDKHLMALARGFWLAYGNWRKIPPVPIPCKQGAYNKMMIGELTYNSLNFGNTSIFSRSVFAGQRFQDIRPILMKMSARP